MQNKSPCKNLSVLGSTGSIGQSTLQVVRHHRSLFCVKALAAHHQIDLLEAQAKEFHPEIIAVYDKTQARILAQRLPGIRVIGGAEGLKEAASWPSVDLCVSAISGAIGIEPTLSAIQAGCDIALANKEVLVAAGDIVMKAVLQHGVKMIPIDSEQSAIFQCLQGYPLDQVDRLILTASGGPFLHREDLSSVTIADALKHPTWKMGVKNTIDSSTLMNKGLEVIEAHWLFNMPLDRIDVVVHPQSLVHSFVEFIDGSLLAQIAENHMVVPIQYALSYPDRIERMVKRFDFSSFSTFQFYPVDQEKFSCLKLAYEAALAGGTLPCFMNAANEVLVQRFVQGEIVWLDIARKLEQLMKSHTVKLEINLEDILCVDQEARAEASHI